MVKVLGIVFITMLVALPIAIADRIAGTQFLAMFAREQSSGIIGTILALNIATVTYLVSHLISIESRAEKTLFSRTKSEIKQSVYAMATLFAMNLLVLAATPRLTATSSNLAKHINFGLAYLNLVILLLTIAALIDIIQAVFTISTYIPPKAKGKSTD